MLQNLLLSFGMSFCSTASILFALVTVTPKWVRQGSTKENLLTTSAAVIFLAMMAVLEFALFPLYAPSFGQVSTLRKTAAQFLTPGKYS